MKHTTALLIVLAVLLVLLSACSSAPTPTPLPTPTQTLAATETPRPTPVPATATLSPSPVSTATPIPSPTALPSATVTFTATVTATPRPSFAGFQVEYTQFTYYGMLMGIRVPGIKENYRLLVDGVEYQCSLNDKAPDRLYCNGTPFKPGQKVTLAFLPLKGDNTPVFQTEYQIVAFVTPTINPQTQIAAGDKCAVRGVNVTCETEYRRNNDTYCIVSTCVDICGYYY